jgi:hypothetical protein
MEKSKSANCRIKPYDVGSYGGFSRNENRSRSFNEKKPYDLNYNNHPVKAEKCVRKGEHRTD